MPSIALEPGVQVKITGGQYNGFTGTLAKTCEAFGSVAMEFERTFHEIVVELKFLTPLDTWLSGKSPAELQALGYGPDHQAS